jgi:hypothetical protein
MAAEASPPFIRQRFCACRMKHLDRARSQASSEISGRPFFLLRA